MNQRHSSDIIHATPRVSIYDRLDYLVNSDMSIPMALANTLRTGIETEISRRSGLPFFDRRPELSPLVLHPANYFPQGKTGGK